MPCPTPADDGIGEREAPALTALNETLRDDYVADCQKGVDRWNRTLAEVGEELALPTSASTATSARSPAGGEPDGRLVDEDDGVGGTRPTWLPTADDRAFVESLMVGVTEPGQDGRLGGAALDGDPRQTRRLRVRDDLIG